MSRGRRAESGKRVGSGVEGTHRGLITAGEVMLHLENGKLVGIAFGNHAKTSGVADSGFGDMPTKRECGGGHVFTL